MHIIDIRDVSFKFSGSSEPVLKDINLRIGTSEFITLTGPSGCGKSTLCLLMCGFLPQEGDDFQGTIHLGRQDVRDHSVYQLSRWIGIVQQDPEAQLCTLSVMDEVAFGPENFLMSEGEINDKVEWALDVVGAKHLIGRETTNLSGGEKQRLAIASILALEPKAIIFDEPTSQLDPKGSAQIFSIITELQRRTDMTIVVVEHKLRQILPLSSRVVVMDQGRILVDTPSDQLKEHRSILQSVGVRLPGQDWISRPPREENGHDGEILRIEGLHMAYPEGKKVLNGVDLSIRKGEKVGLMGDNGSGKSTLLLNILGLEQPKSGKIILDGKDANRMSMKDRAKTIGFIFQNPNHQIFESTVIKEVLFATENFGMDATESVERSRKLLESCNIGQYVERHPYGLSYGEKRRLNLASIFIYMPKLLLMDEPFIGQDLNNLNQLMSLTDDFARNGGGAIMVLHEPEIAEMYCDRLVFLRDGKIVVDEPTSRAFHILREMGEIEYVPEVLPNGPRP
ncbi:MAG: energy-coupling factor ABC transporter ATP-binding protein [Methanomassiliicoccales archaeon]|nr:energy-coupling factor ABC transporter ATP-binding protein [Methanomassiliicoccales archaeon]NYT14376.1 energy-coupling factor ABC transporter ATP-binding protein [Methanomassiliicoccales archaeon]